MKCKFLVTSALYVFLLCLASLQPAHANEVIYDDVVFAPYVLDGYDGTPLLTINTPKGTLALSYENFDKLKGKIEAINKKNSEEEESTKNLAFFLKLGVIVDVANVTKDKVRLHPTYAETKEYYAIKVSFVNADANHTYKISKELNPLSYKMSESFLKSFGDTAYIYSVDGEIVAIQPATD